MTKGKPWHLKEGFLLGAGLIVMGLVLQLSIGPINWSIFTWPVNIVALGVLVAVIVGMHLLRRRGGAFQFLATFGAAVPALAYGTLLTVVMGLTRQEPDGSWLSDMLTFWPFVLIYTYIELILGLVILKQISVVIAHRSPLMLRPSFIAHLGLFMALAAGTLGNADMKQLQMWTTNNPELANHYAGSDAFHQYERFALDENGRHVELPIAVELKRFIMEMYEDSVTPKRYASEVVIYSKASNHQYAATIDVNKPVTIDGWKIYQKDYRLTDAGDQCQISILELVSDPWLPWVYAGIFLMLAGALLMLFTGRGKELRVES
ncbi:MAG: cytochrome c biogenesis protein ResB [Prevotella sp.]|nr:cytochrome c biogenesis protein ResB [Prevotella sp.]